MASQTRSGRLAFVPVRFGDDLVGGAEMLVRETADGLAARGWSVDVLTGCARDHFREPHHYAPGVTERPGAARLVRFPSVVSSHRADRVLGNRALAAGQLTQPKILEACKSLGLESIVQLAQRPDVVPQLALLLGV